ncbi:hypothetical protein EHP00_2348 [Ecytonucleospora hepatopenaei]|uniref:Uncharacterized protein n=1 Tax=Ecytonucleospora hepatopenaei TaxID=646526 RepID=A0A1W0E9C3_9MICR|nr:hypothetical protein EHP00_2348 [Ecytonucleospora hepatopenaei]
MSDNTNMNTSECIIKLEDLKEKCKELENDIDALVSLAKETENLDNNINKFLK